MMPMDALEMAGRLGLKRYPRSWRGPCPCCGYRDAFAILQSRHGSPRLFCASGCTRDQLAVAVGTDAPSPSLPAHVDRDTPADRARRTEAALRVWRGAVPLRHHAAAPGLTYLASRGIEHVASCGRLRFRSDCKHPERGEAAALIGLVTDIYDQPIAIHRTYLTRDGSAKSKILPQKATLGPTWGGCVRLGEPAEGQPLIIAEGLETAGAASLIFGAPAHAALSCGNLAKLTLPPQVQRIILAADHDIPLPNGRRPGQDAAAEAAARWRREGRHVEIAAPDRPGSDFADLLMERRSNGR
jgi:putative DNA primase/helicase